MQTLEYDGKKQDYSQEFKDLIKRTGDELQGIQVKVEEDFKAGSVKLFFGETPYFLTPNGARDLALALRRSAARVENELNRIAKEKKRGKK